MKTFKEFVNEITVIPYADIEWLLKDGIWETDGEVLTGNTINVRSGYGLKRTKKMIMRMEKEGTRKIDNDIIMGKSIAIKVGLGKGTQKMK